MFKFCCHSLSAEDAGGKKLRSLGKFILGCGDAGVLKSFARVVVNLSDAEVTTIEQG